MRARSILVLAVGGATITSGCYGCPYVLRGPPDPIALPSEPRPIPGLNSAYDDYNAAAPYQMAEERLIFSSNRGSKGKSFDLYTIDVLLIRDEIMPRGEVEPYLPKAMSPADELGPTLLSHGAPRLIFASNRSGGAGGLDLWWYPTSTEAPPRAFEGVNTPHDDAYWTWVEGSREALFASNRDGDWDIYALSPPLPDDSGQRRVRRVDELSSPADDTAPYLFAHEELPEAPKVSLNPGRAPRERTGAKRVYVLFASTRRGGQFDLYCARREGTAFTEPQPLSVNSRFKDFRPITVLDGAGLIFSSDRPGGAGGMDLWYAALENPCRP
jgi:hypothetical protein